MSIAFKAVQPDNRFDISLIRANGGTQSRAEINQAVVDDYAAAIGNGASFPAITVFYDGNDYWLADGFHRYHAHLQLGLADIDADVRQGTRREAILYSVGANEAHGLRRTNEDKRRAVLTLLGDEEWAGWSDREIARRCHVDHVTVGRIRKDTGAVHQNENRTFTHHKTGKPTTMNTSAIGKSNDTTTDDEMEDQKRPSRDGGKKAWVKIAVPEGENIAELCRRGLALEDDGMPIEKAATAVGISVGSYRIVRQIVFLADYKNLSPDDAALAKNALDLVVANGQITGVWETVEPLAARVWGEGNRVFGLAYVAGRRIDQFEKSLGVVGHTCVATDQITLPYLSPDQVKASLREIGRARAALQRFADRIKDSHK